MKRTGLELSYLPVATAIMTVAKTMQASGVDDLTFTIFLSRLTRVTCARLGWDVVDFIEFLDGWVFEGKIRNYPELKIPCPIDGRGTKLSRAERLRPWELN